MIALFKDRYRIGLVLGALFLIGMLASLYQIYRLPYNMMVGTGYHPALSNVFVALGITFLLGAFTIWLALNNRNEVIVFRDKQIDLHQASQDAANAQQKSTISLDSVKESIRQSHSEKDILQNGVQAVCKLLEAGQGAAYMISDSDGKKTIELRSGYALSIGENTKINYDIGEGLIGQAAASGRTLYIDEVPEGYVKVVSGLGMASPRYILIVPVKNQNNVSAVIEIASFTPISEDQRKFVEESAQLMGEKIAAK